MPENRCLRAKKKAKFAQAKCPFFASPVYTTCFVAGRGIWDRLLTFAELSLRPFLSRIRVVVVHDARTVYLALFAYFCFIMQQRPESIDELALFALLSLLVRKLTCDLALRRLLRHMTDSPGGRFQKQAAPLRCRRRTQETH